MTAIDTDVAAVQRMFDVNVFGPMRMVRSFHPLLIKAAGAIVNIGSVGGISPYVYGCKNHFPSGDIWSSNNGSIVQCNKSSHPPLGKYLACGNGTIQVSDIAGQSLLLC
jgi:hypothetical protein